MTHYTVTDSKESILLSAKDSTITCNNSPSGGRVLIPAKIGRLFCIFSVFVSFLRLLSSSKFFLVLLSCLGSWVQCALDRAGPGSHIQPANPTRVNFLALCLGLPAFSQAGKRGWANLQGFRLAFCSDKLLRMFLLGTVTAVLLGWVLTCAFVTYQQIQSRRYNWSQKCPHVT